MNIQLYLDDYTRLWHQASKDFKPVNGVISLEEKQQREEGLMRFSKALQQETGRVKNVEINREQLMLQFKEQFGHFFKNSFNFNAQENAIIADSG
ncbi:MAG: hypothetical protein JXR22_04450, partial [Prolixibacteraceae bacterium]|nr:hypothetical protein [Prolixibacteraceae bacterium]